jgi:hypothetical protein
LNTEGCELSALEIERFERALDPLRGLVEKFPVSDLQIGVEFHPHSKSYEVKLALDLPSRKLRTGEVDQRMFVAFDKSVQAMLENVLSYQEELGGLEERAKHQKGTRHDLIPTGEPDWQALQQAVRDRDYESFRQALFVYEEPLRLRIGRWIQRYPELNARLGERVSLPDIIEEVFLNAFEQYESRPQQRPLGEWLDHLVDPSLKELLASPTQELENIGLIRSQRAATHAE